MHPLLVVVGTGVEIDYDLENCSGVLKAVSRFHDLRIYRYGNLEKNASNSVR